MKPVNDAERPLPFSLRFRTKEGERAVPCFVTEPSALSAARGALAIAENQDISLLFRAPADFRFTMDGLDVVAVPGAERGEEGEELSPQDRAVRLFEGQNFPLVPGYYVVTVRGRWETWYGLIEIVPRYLGRQQWQAMREELLSDIRNLSFDFMKRTMNIDRPLETALGLSGSMLLRFYIVDDMSARVLAALTELAHSANSRITRRPVRLSPGMAVRGRVRPSAGGAYGLLPRTTYDVAENRFAKTVLLSLSRSLREFADALSENERRVAAEQAASRRYRENYQSAMRKEALGRFEEYGRRARKLLAAVSRVSEAPWFDEARETPAPEPTLAAVRDPRYAALWRLSKRLAHPEESLAVSSYYTLQWQRTDKLYELWCVLTFTKALAQKGWRLGEGPAVTEEGGQYVLESLAPETRLIFTRGEEEIHALYDAPIPSTAAGTDRATAPLYSNNSHRRPDLRIDYYRRGAYAGSLVCDFKYRDVYRLWEDRENSRGMREQFNAYRDMNTKWYKDFSETESLRSVRPVKEVWAVFPRETPPLSDEDFSLRFIPLAPGLPGNEKLAELLETYFAEL